MIQTSSATKKKRIVQFASEEDQVIPNNTEHSSSNSYGDETITDNLTHKFFSPKLGAPGSIRFRSREDRTRTAREAGINSTGGTVSNPDFADTLRRVSVVVQQHIIRGERVKRKYHQKLAAAKRDAVSHPSASSPSRSNTYRNNQTSNSRYDPPGSPEMTVTFDPEGHVGLTGDRRKRTPSSVQLAGTTGGGGESKTSTASEPRISLAAQLSVAERLAASSSFREDLFVKPTWKYTFVRPVAGSGLFLTHYRLNKVKKTYHLPEVKEIHAFINNLFIKGQLSAECSVVCLIYVERLMENAGIEILASNWRPIMLCGLLLASKVWQDLSTWNVEFESISPDFTLKSINVLERTFLKYLRYSLFISGSVYARYYFALRSLTEKKDFRRRYNHVVMGGRPVPNSRMVEQRTEALKNQVCARSM